MVQDKTTVTTHGTTSNSASGYAALLSGFRLHLTIGGLRPSTIAHYLRDAERFCCHLNGRPLGGAVPATVRNHLAAYQENHSSKTVREAQIALRRFFRWLQEEGEIQEDPMRNMRLAAFRVEPQPTYTKEEIKRLLRCCDPKTPLGVRDRALVLILWDTGVRESELLSMQAVDWKHRNIQVSGKTGTRNVPLGGAALRALDRYRRHWCVEGGTFWRGGHGPLTASGVLQIVRRLCRRAGVQHKGVHAFRRAAAAEMKRLGMNDSDILEICGWKSVIMLRRYTATVAGELAQRAHDLYSPADNL